jgi:hypothetical protein
MWMTYSPEAGALAVVLAERGRRGPGTVEFAPGGYAEFDRRGRLVALEVLGASRHYARAALGDGAEQNAGHGASPLRSVVQAAAPRYVSVSWREAPCSSAPRARRARGGDAT